MKFQTKEIRLTPEMAEGVLAGHENIRNISHRTVLQYAQDMIAGDWIECHPSGLVFDALGRLIDGQHRLHAQVRAGVTLTWHATYGAGEDVSRTIDCGMRRPDAVRLFGRDPHGSRRVTVAKVLHMIFVEPTTASPAGVSAVLQAMDCPGVDVVYSHNGKPQITGPVRAAFVYAFPCNNVSKIWRDLIDGSGKQDTSPYGKTFQALDALRYSKHVNGAGARRSLFMQTTSCIAALLEGRAIMQARVSKTALEYISKRRAAAGFAPVWPRPLIKRAAKAFDDDDAGAQ